MPTPTQESRDGADCPSLQTALARMAQQGWFAGIGAPVRDRLGAIARLKRCDRNATIYHVGDPADGLYGLVEGAIDVAIPGEQGIDFTVHRADPGFWVGDLALVSGQTRLITLRAATPVTLVHLPGAPLRALADTDIEEMRALYALSHLNTATALRLLANLGVTSSEARIGLRLLYQMETAAAADGWVALSQAALSEMLALSPPTVQRSLKRLQDRGLIDCGYGRIRICDKAGLIRHCGG